MLVDCHNTKTKVISLITLNDHKLHRESSNPIQTGSKYLWLAGSTRKHDSESQSVVVLFVTGWQSGARLSSLVKQKQGKCELLAPSSENRSWDRLRRSKSDKNIGHFSKAFRQKLYIVINRAFGQSIVLCPFNIECWSRTLMLMRQVV